MKIRFIIDVVSSEFDVNGNRSHFATLTSTQTGKSLSVEIGGPGNMRRLLCDVFGRTFDCNYPNVYSTECTLGRRDWKQAAKSRALMYERMVTKEMVLALETD